MALPKAVREVGTVETTRVVYIEDYVLQYLTVCEEEDEGENTEAILYGRKERSGEAEIYIIYGICRQTGQGFDRKYRRLGYLHQETGAIVLDDCEPWQTLKGYYVFYDAEEKMKECLGEYYERKLWQKKQGVAQPQSSAAELVALSSVEDRRRESPFLWVRMVVLFIFIIFCAIAVMTVNSFDKLNDFIQTAVMTEEIMDTEERN